MSTAAGSGGGLGSWKFAALASGALAAAGLGYALYRGSSSGGKVKQPADLKLPMNPIPRAPVVEEECIVPEHPSRTNRLKVVVVHGDPSKPNRILPGGWWDDDDYDAVNQLRKALATLTDTYDFKFLCSHDTLYEDLKRLKAAKEVDIVLQFCDEGFNNDPRQELHTTALLECLRIPYTGTGTHNIAFAYDKDFILNVCRSMNVPIPKSQYFAPGEDPMTHTLPYPVLVKPNSTDGSYGITSLSVCKNSDELKRALGMMRDTFKLTKIAILVQEYLPGKDVNFAVFGNPVTASTATVDSKTNSVLNNKDGTWSGVGGLPMPVTEEDYSKVPEDLPRVLGFESKWLPNSPYWLITTIATKLSPKQQQLIVDCSHRLFTRLGYRDYARFDWRCDAAGEPRLLEINPNCGWCLDGHLAKTAHTAGITYPMMMDGIIRTAWARHQSAVRDKLDHAPANMDELCRKLGATAAGAATAAAPAPATAAAPVDNRMVFVPIAELSPEARAAVAANAPAKNGVRMATYSDCVNGLQRDDGSCVCFEHWTGESCDIQFKREVYDGFLPLAISACLMCGLLTGLGLHQIYLQLTSGAPGTIREKWTVKVTVITGLTIASFVRVIYYLFSNYFGIFDVPLTRGADTILFEIPLIFELSACLQIALYWLELTDPTAERWTRRALIAAIITYPSVSVTFAIFISTDPENSDRSRLLYNAWLSLWMIVIGGGFMVWGRRLRRILAPIQQSRGSYQKVSAFMIAISLDAVSTITVLFFASITDSYDKPKTWIVFVGINRYQEILFVVIMLIALAQSGSTIATQGEERSLPVITDSSSQKFASAEDEDLPHDARWDSAGTGVVHRLSVAPAPTSTPATPFGTANPHGGATTDSAAISVPLTTGIASAAGVKGSHMSNASHSVGSSHHAGSESVDRVILSPTPGMDGSLATPLLARDDSAAPAR